MKRNDRLAPREPEAPARPIEPTGCPQRVDHFSRLDSLFEINRMLHDKTDKLVNGHVSIELPGAGFETYVNNLVHAPIVRAALRVVN